jgi:hypothetical protein
LETQRLEKGEGGGRRMKPLLWLMRTDITFSFRLREMKTETGLRYSGIREIKNVWEETVEDEIRDC